MCDVDGYYTRLPITITLSKIMEIIEQFSPHSHMFLFYKVFFYDLVKKIRITMRETMLLGSSKVSINIMCISIQKYPHEPSHSHQQGFIHAHSTRKAIHNLLMKIKFVANLASWEKKPLFTSLKIYSYYHKQGHIIELCFKKHAHSLF